MHPIFAEIFGWEALLVLLLLLLLFGGSKLPGLARSLGEATRELKKGLSDDDGNEPRSTNEEPPKPSA
jgi:sec-independent protein translocase protein TatA